MAGLDDLSGLFQPLLQAKVYYTTKRKTQNNTKNLSPQNLSPKDENKVVKQMEGAEPAAL